MKARDLVLIILGAVLLCFLILAVGTKYGSEMLLDFALEWGKSEVGDDKRFYNHVMREWQKNDKFQ